MELHVQPRESEVECTGHLGAVVEFATHAGRRPAYWGMRGVKRGGLPYVVDVDRRSEEIDAHLQCAQHQAVISHSATREVGGRGSQRAR